MDQNDSGDELSPIEILKEMFQQESINENYIKLKLSQIEEKLLDLKLVKEQSRKKIDNFWASILNVLECWKGEFIKDLEESSTHQETVLLLEKKQLLQDQAKFNALLSAAKVSLNGANSLDGMEDIAMNCLSAVSSILCNLSQDIPYQPCSFIPNKNFTFQLHSDIGRHKMGYIHFEEIDIKSFRLEQTEEAVVGSCVEFTVLVPEQYDSETILDHVSHMISTEGTKVVDTIFFNDRDIRLNFYIMKESVHEVNFCIFHQHISGSPFSFLPQKSLPAVMPVPVPKKSSSVPDGNCSQVMKDSESGDNLVREVVKQEASLFSPTTLPPDIHLKSLKKLVDRRATVARSDTLRPLRRPLKNHSLLPKHHEISDQVPNDIEKPDLQCKSISSFKPNFTSTQTGIAEKLELILDSSSNVEDSLQPDEKTLLADDFLVEAGTSNGPINGNVTSDRMTSTMDRSEKIDLLSNEKDKLASRTGDFKSLKPRPCLKFGHRLRARCTLCYSGIDELRLNKSIGIAELKSGEIVVADTFNDRMLLFSEGGEFRKEFNAHIPLSKPSAITVLPNGQFAVRDNHGLCTFSPDCKPLANLGSEFLQRPYGIAQDGDGNLITIDTKRSGELSIIRLDALTGKLLSSIIVKDLWKPQEHLSMEKLSKPRFLACSPPSTLLVVDLGLDCFYILNLDSGELVKKIGQRGSGDGQFSDPSGIDCDADGFIIVGDSRNHRLQIFSPDGEFLSVLKVDRRLSRPSGLCLTRSGHILVLNYWQDTFVKYEINVVSEE